MNGHDALFGCLGSPERRYVVRELDEGGTTSLKEVAAEIADDDRRVIVSGTDQTFRGEPFEPVPRLIALAEYVDKYQAICAVCGEPATRNQRLVGGEPAHYDDPTIMVGAEESYEARCRSCHTVRRE